MILLFIDDVRLTNAGSYYMAYIVLGNFPHYFRSKLESMEVIAAVPSDIVERHGNNEVWKHLLFEYDVTFQKEYNVRLGQTKYKELYMLYLLLLLQITKELMSYLTSKLVSIMGYDVVGIVGFIEANLRLEIDLYSNEEQKLNTIAI
jgi:hypothetical protein